MAADELRQAIVERHFQSVFLPSEQQLMVALNVSRPTVRAALTQLRAEGLVESVPGTGWRQLDLARDPTFELAMHRFDHLADTERLAFLETVLAHRTNQVVGAVTMLLRSRSPVSEEADRKASVIRVAVHSWQYTHDTLEMEDAFLAALTAGNPPDLPHALAANQVRRLLAHVRGWLDMVSTLPPMGREAKALVEAIAAHQPDAVELAHAFASARLPIYLTLARERLERCQNGNAVGN